LELEREKLDNERKQMEAKKVMEADQKSKQEPEPEKKVQKVQGRQAVADWLNEHNLGQYYQKFVDCGYESLEVCALIDDTELVAMDIGKPGHRKALLQACQQLKENAALGKTVGIDEKKKNWKEQQQEWPNKVEQKEKIDQPFDNDPPHIPITITPETKEPQQTPLSTPRKAEEQNSNQLHVHYSSLDSESSDTIFSESEQEEDIFANK